MIHSSLQLQRRSRLLARQRCVATLLRHTVAAGGQQATSPHVLRQTPIRHRARKTSAEARNPRGKRRTLCKPRRRQKPTWSACHAMTGHSEARSGTRTAVPPEALPSLRTSGAPAPSAPSPAHLITSAQALSSNARDARARTARQQLAGGAGYAPLPRAPRDVAQSRADPEEPLRSPELHRRATHLRKAARSLLGARVQEA